MKMEMSKEPKNKDGKERQDDLTHEKSCGALVFRREAGTGTYYILMIRHRRGGYRSFPKGHMEAGESERQTAVREVMEETSVRIRIRSPFRQRIRYSPTPGVSKDVIYFLARTENPEIHAREGEIAEVEWIPVRGAEPKLSHANDRAVFRAALRALRRELRRERDPASVHPTGESAAESKDEAKQDRKEPAGEEGDK